MTANELFEPNEENLDAYDDLIVSIQAKEHGLSLLIAVCDDLNLREQIIAQYEAELQPEFHPYRVTLARGEPSLRAAIAQLVESEQYLRQGGKAVITVMGAEQLYFLKLGEERSEQEIFFGYLQWTREALREFPFAIVLWVTHQILVDLIKQAPDFWSWRKGVFRFVSKKTLDVYGREVAILRPYTIYDSELASVDDDNPHFLPLEDLQQLIKQIEQRNLQDPSLATLYSRLGDLYKRRLNWGEFQDYKTEQNLAIEYYCLAVELQKKLGLEIDLATSLNNLAALYSSQGRYNEAESLYLQALELYKYQFGDNHPDVATTLNNLAALYRSTGRYSQAESLLVEVLELYKHLLGVNHTNVATSLSNLGYVYKSQGRYGEAEPLYLQALELRKRLLGENHPDVSALLNDLALLYDSAGRYSEAEPLYLQALELKKHLLGENHPSVALTLNNLALLYYHQGRYSEAEPLSLQAIEIDRCALGEEHPDLATDIHNLALIYRNQGRYSEAEPLFIQALAWKERLLPKDHPLLADTIYALGSMYRLQGRYSEAEPLLLRALELDKRLWGDNHFNVADSLNTLASLYQSQGRYSEAEPLYQQVLKIFERLSGVNHPNTILVRENLASVRDRLASDK